MTDQLTLINTSEGLGRGPWMDINLSTLRTNLKSITSVLSTDSQLMVIVKSDAYGHGLKPIVETAVAAGISHFAVAYEEEALQVRRVSSNAEILILGVTTLADLSHMAENNIIPAIISRSHALQVMEHARSFDRPLRVHLKVDTGMGRLGVTVDEADEVASMLQAAPGIELVGVFSHFATVDPSRPVAAEEQVARFQSLDVFKKAQLLRHISSTRAVLYFPQWDFDAVRAGVSVYGYGTSAENARFKTRPVLQWKTSVMQAKTVPAETPVGYYRAYQTIEPADIITVKVGYADGYPRMLSNKGYVLIQGKRLRVVGRISMNWITVLAPAGSGIEAGDEVVLIGEQGDESIWADELAHICDTIAYEIVTSIRPGTPRTYLQT